MKFFADTADIADIRETLRTHSDAFVQVNGRIDILTLEMRSKFDMLAAGQERIVDLLTHRDD